MGGRFGDEDEGTPCHWLASGSFPAAPLPYPPDPWANAREECPVEVGADAEADEVAAGFVQLTLGNTFGQ